MTIVPCARLLAECGFFEDPDLVDDNPLEVICERAGLTVTEYEAVAMHANGFKYKAIGRMQWPRRSEDAVRTAELRGIAKLRRLLGVEALPRQAGQD